MIAAVLGAAQAADPSGRIETAALPTDSPIGANGLPMVLARADVKRYREIFALQDEGAFEAADQRINELRDPLLMGHVLAQRYLHPEAYRSEFAELEDWLSTYGDHPDGLRIYKLALRRKPAEATDPDKPIVYRIGIAAQADGAAVPYRSPLKRSKATRAKVSELKAQIRDNVRKQRLSATERLLWSDWVHDLLDPVELDQARASIAWGWFLYGNDEKAFTLADLSARNSGAEVPHAHWTAGLAAWRLGLLKAAAYHFEKLADNKRASSWLAAAGGYWAGRVHRELDHTGATIRALVKAAEHHNTFYGLLARRTLGMPLGFDFAAPRLTPHLMARLESLPATRRALALFQIGERARAESELVRVAASGDHGLAEALLALAEAAHLPRLAFRLGSLLTGKAGASATSGLDAALYPVPPWQPESGFVVDRALVYAMIRQESRFDPEAKSGIGARGLMQLMPTTADFIAKAKSRFSKGGEELLHDPETNVDLGQRYLAHLLDHQQVRGGLFHLAAAYNGGPGNLRKWQKQMERKDDPLLFIESLPSGETRLFIERVLTNFWVYRARLGQPMPSLDALVAGQWPGYAPLDGLTQELAQNGAN